MILGGNIERLIFKLDADGGGDGGGGGNGSGDGSEPGMGGSTPSGDTTGGSPGDSFGGNDGSEPGMMGSDPTSSSTVSGSAGTVGDPDYSHLADNDQDLQVELEAMGANLSNAVSTGVAGDQSDSQAVENQGILDSSSDDNEFNGQQTDIGLDLSGSEPEDLANTLSIARAFDDSELVDMVDEVYSDMSISDRVSMNMDYNVIPDKLKAAFTMAPFGLAGTLMSQAGNIASFLDGITGTLPGGDGEGDPADGPSYTQEETERLEPDDEDDGLLNVPTVTDLAGFNPVKIENIIT